MPAWIIGKPVTNKTKVVLGTTIAVMVLKKLFYKKYF
jgi:hypothetical protein